MRSPWRRTLVASAATAGGAGRESIASSDSPALAGVARQLRQQHRRLEQVIAHQQREPSIGEAVAGREHRDAVLEMPVRVVRKLHTQSGRRRRLDRRHARCAPDSRARPRPRRSRRRCAVSRVRRMSGLAEHRLKQLRLPGSILKAVAVTGGKHEGVPHRDGRTSTHDHLESCLAGA